MPKLSTHIHSKQPTQLFQFCLRVLRLRRPSQKINNQHLGQLLHLSPSDTSHWKRGKKIFKNAEYIQMLSNNLNIDLEILQDLVDGSMTMAEAWCEFEDAEAESHILQNHTLKKKLFSPPEFLVHAKKLEHFAANVLKTVSAYHIPVDVTELIKAFPFICLLPSDSVNKLAVSARIKPGSYVIRYLKNNHRPHTRLAIARELAHIILTEPQRCPLSPPLFSNLIPFTSEEIIALSNAFLMPQEALTYEIQKTSTNSHLFKSLANTFCVPKSALRKRLATLLCQSVATN